MEHDVTSLRDHVEIMKRRWRLLVAGLVLGVAAGLGLSAMQATEYSAEATLLLDPGRTPTSATVMDPDEVATQANVVASVAVAERVLDELGLDESPQRLLGSVTVSVIDQTRTVAVVAARPTASEAAEVANAFANQYVAHRVEEAVGNTAAVRAALQSQLSTVTAELSTVREELEQEPGPDRTSLLEAQEQSLVALQADLQTQVMLLGSPTEPTPGGELLYPAEPPARPSQPRPLSGAALGGLLGLVLGTLVAYARDRFDDGIRDEQRLKSTLGAVPVLGRIPEEARRTIRPAALVDPHSSASEAYRSLTTNVRFLSAGHRPSRKEQGELLVVSSSVAGEGKTTLATNIAVTAARVGFRVLLVDADLRDPKVNDRFGIETPVGLSHVLAESGRLQEAVTDVPLGFGSLRIIGAGAVPPNPAELLAGPRASRLWQQLRGVADLVVVDTAPLLGVADTLEIVREADLVLLAVRHRVSRVHQVQSSMERVRQVGGDVSGVVWCALPVKEGVYGYGLQVASL